MSDMGLNPAMHPAYLAFLRALGLQNATDAVDAQAAIDRLNARAGLSREEIIDQGGIQREGIQGGYEARGLWRSGAKLRDLNRQRASEGRALGGVELNVADQSAQLISELARRRAAGERQTAEKAYDVTADLFGMTDG